MPDYSSTGAAVGGLFGPIGAGVGALAGGLLSGIVGGGQKKKGKRLLNSLEYPTEQLAKEEVENTNLLRQQAATGLPSEQYAKAMKDIQRQQVMAIMGAHDRRGGLGIIPGIQQATNDATTNLNVQDAAMRINNQGRLVTQNARVGQIKRDLFDRNVRQKYDRDRNYAMSLIGAGNQNLIGGLDKGAAGLGYLSSGLFGEGRIRSKNTGTNFNTEEAEPHY